MIEEWWLHSFYLGWLSASAKLTASGEKLHVHGAVREEVDTCLDSYISCINPADQWGNRCCSQIALTSTVQELSQFISGSATIYLKHSETSGLFLKAALLDGF